MLGIGNVEYGPLNILVKKKRKARKDPFCARNNERNNNEKQARKTESAAPVSEKIDTFV